MKKSTRIITVSVLSIFCLALALLWVRHRSLLEAQHTQHYNIVPSVPNPDYRKIGKNMDNAYAALQQKELQVSMQIVEQHLPKPEYERRMNAVKQIGYAEINRVRATGYTQSFNPDVWKQLPFLTD